jgi:hypothetical protein
MAANPLPLAAAQGALGLRTAVLKPTPVYGTQRTLNGEVHNWYRLTLGFPDHLVGMLIDEIGLNSSHEVLDPFCGSGSQGFQEVRRCLRM